MSDSVKKWVAIWTFVTGAILTFGACVKVLSDLARSFIKGARDLLLFSDAIPSVVKLPQTLEAQNRVLADQSELLKQLHAESIEKAKTLKRVEEKIEAIEAKQNSTAASPAPRVQT